MDLDELNLNLSPTFLEQEFEGVCGSINFSNSGEVQLSSSSQPGSQSSLMSYTSGNSQNHLIDVSHNFLDHQSIPLSNRPTVHDPQKMNTNNNNYHTPAFKLISTNDTMNYDEDKFSLPSSSSQSGSEMEQSQNTGTQSSIVSTDTGSQELLQLAESWPGIYKFSVSVVPAKNTYYSEKQDMFFCQPSTTAFFSFSYNFKAAVNSHMFLRVSLRFNHPETGNEIVKTCDFHKTKREAYMREHPDEAQEMKGRIDHVVTYEKRSDRQKPSYEIGRNGIYYVVVPLSKPRAEQTSMVERFQFDCMNSCAGRMTKKTKLTLVFELCEGKNVIGRRPMQLKVCMCPRRDFQVAESGESRKKKKKMSKASKTSKAVKVVKTKKQIQKKYSKAHAPVLPRQESQATSSDGSQSQEKRSPDMTVLLQKAEYVLKRMDDDDDLVSFLSKKLSADIDEYFSQITKLYNTASASIHQSTPNAPV